MLLPGANLDSPKMAHRRTITVAFSVSDVFQARCLMSLKMTPRWLRMPVFSPTDF